MFSYLFYAVAITLFMFADGYLSVFVADIGETHFYAFNIFLNSIHF